MKNCSLNVANDPFRWFAAYDKSALLYIANTLGNIPDTALCYSPKNLPHLWKNDPYVVKSGFGVKKTIQRKHLEAVVVRGSDDISDAPRHKYVVQKFIEPENEVRIYTCKFGPRSKSLMLRMPTGSRSSPDWRDATNASNLQVSIIQDAALSVLCASVLAKLGLSYVCLDVISKEGVNFVIDINPHGSWTWLPAESASCVEQFMLSFIRSTLSKP